MTTPAPGAPGVSCLPTDAIPQTTSIPSPSYDESHFSLEPILRVFEHEWVWNFFFAPESDIHEELKHAVKQTFFKSVEYSLKLANQFPVNSDTTFFNGFGNLFILSSFSTGDISVGYAVDELVQSSTATLQPHLTLFRVVRDDINTFYISISEDPDVGLVYFNGIRLISPARRQNFVMNFHYKRFRFAVESLRNGHFDENLFRKAMIKIIYVNESRTCPRCLTLPTRPPCPCELSVCRMRHPLDILSDSNNLALYLGYYSGPCNITVYKSPSAVPFTLRFASNSSTLLSQDPGVQERLCEWALTHSAQMRKISIPRFPMTNFFQQFNEDHASGRTNSFTPGILRQDIRNAASDIFMKSNFGSIGMAPRTNEDFSFKRRNQLALANGFPIEQAVISKMENSCTESQLEGNSVNNNQAVGKRNDFLLALFQNENQQGLSPFSVPETGTGTLQTQISGSTPPDCGRAVEATTGFDLIGGESPILSSTVNSTQIMQSHHPEQSAASRKNSQIRAKVVPIAPSPFSQGEQGDNEAQRSFDADGENSKDKRRKINNRISAQESYRKRKQREQEEYSKTLIPESIG